jgi:hypothetical protein
MASSTLIPSSLPNIEAELLFVKTLLLSVPLAPKKLDVFVKADLKLARTSSLSTPFDLAFGSRRWLVKVVSLYPFSGAGRVPGIFTTLR